MNETLLPIDAATCVVRKTDSKKGRTKWVAPGLAAVRQLHYGRIIVDGGAEPLRFDTGGLETGLICLKGQATVATAGQSFEMTPYDAIYVPRDSSVEVRAGASGCDLAEVAAPVENRYPLKFVSFSAIQKDPGLHFIAGGATEKRNLNILIGKNVEAGRIVAGVTFSEPGHWTSWPPHEHSKMLEEAYLYIAMPAPAWGVQFVYNTPAEPELVAVVREGDCVVMPQGYHPNVAAPGGSIGFLWMMAAHREVEDRQFGVVNVQPEYAGTASGLDAGRAKK